MLWPVLIAAVVLTVMLASDAMTKTFGAAVADAIRRHPVVSATVHRPVVTRQGPNPLPKVGACIELQPAEDAASDGSVPRSDASADPSPSAESGTSPVGGVR